MVTWQQIEKIFNRALRFSFSRQKWLLVFLPLVLCGFLIVIFRTMSSGAGPWFQMTLAFLPIFLSAALLLGVGMVLTRIYHHEVKGLKIEYLKVIKSSSSLFLGIAYLTVPLIGAYLFLWIIMGIFYLMRAIPSIGPFMSAILSFGPFLLVLGSLILSLFNLLILFYVTPAAALKSELSPQLAEEVLKGLKVNPFLAFIMPLVAFFPLLLVVGFLSLSAVVTQMMYVESMQIFSIALRWFFMMLPFCALLTPAIIFFFNFACEAHILFHKTAKE